DLGFVREILPPVLGFVRWLERVRDVNRDGLVTIIQPDESGLDASPKYDAAMAIPSQPPETTLPAWRRSMHRLFDAYKGKSHEEQATLDVFGFEDVMVNVIYADALRALTRLVGAAGIPGADDLERASRRT